MKTTEVRSFSLPTKVSQKLERLAEKLYEEEKIRKPSVSEAVSYVLEKAIADLRKPVAHATALPQELELTQRSAHLAQLSQHDQEDTLASRAQHLNPKQAAALTSYLEALKGVRGIKASWKQIPNTDVRLGHSDWRLNIGPAYYDPINSGSVVGLLYGEDGGLIPGFPAIEIRPGGRLALPAIHSYPEGKAPHALQPHPHGRTAFDAALFADSHIRKQDALHPQLHPGRQASKRGDIDGE